MPGDMTVTFVDQKPGNLFSFQLMHVNYHIIVTTLNFEYTWVNQEKFNVLQDCQIGRDSLSLLIIELQTS